MSPTSAGRFAHVALPVVLACFSYAVVQPSSAQSLRDSVQMLRSEGLREYRQGTGASSERAIELWTRALPLLRRLGDQAGEGVTLNNIGYVEDRVGRPDSALAHYRQALPIVRALRNGAGEGTTLNNIGYVQGRLGRPDSALAYYRQALAVRREVRDSAGEGETLQNIGAVHYRLGRPDSALVYDWQALVVERHVGNRIAEGATLNNIGTVEDGLGRPDSALVYFREALAIRRQVMDRAGEGTTLSNIGHVHSALGRSDSALTYYRQALVTQAELADRTGEGETLNDIGYVQSKLGHPDSALAYYRRALAVQREATDRAGEGATLNNIGAVHSGLGRPDSALAYYRRALAVRREVRDRVGEGTTLGNIGHVHAGLGRRDSALAYYGQALAIAREVRDRAGEGTSLNNIGHLYSVLGDLDSALAYFREALAVRREMEDRAGEAATLTNIAGLGLPLGYPDTALVYYRRALTIWRHVGDRSSEGTTLHNIGYVQGRLGHPDSALTYYGQALAVAREVGDRAGEGTTLAHLGWLYQRMRVPPDLPAAVAYYDSAAAARVAVMARAGGEANRVSYAEQHVDLFEAWTLGWLAQQAGLGAHAAAEAGLAASERGRAQALLDLIRSGAGENQPGRDLIAEGARLVQAATGAGAGLLSYLVTADTLVLWLSAPGYELEVRRQPVPRDTLAELVRALRDALDVDEAARGRVALRGGEPPEPVAPAAARGARSRGWRAGSYDAISRALAGLLLPPDLERALGTARELVIVPHGVLGLVPFAALPLDSARTPLGTRYALRYAPSLAVLADVEARPGLPAGSARTRELRGALVVGNPNMPAEASWGAAFAFDSLPGAAVEGRWVAGQLGTSLLTGGGATEVEVRRRLPQARAVHLATHGYAYAMDSMARLSFIALGPSPLDDGFLTVGDVLDDPGLKLSADLIVLSACQTGLGDLKQAEGTVGLQRAFLAKGARSMLVSLWSISDAATALLMRGFYTHWLGDSDYPSKAEALRRAQAGVRADSLYAEPKFWAAFQLVGAH